MILGTEEKRDSGWTKNNERRRRYKSRVMRWTEEGDRREDKNKMIQWMEEGDRGGDK